MTLAGNIRVIPAERKMGNRVSETTVRKRRVAAYCRVSTEYEEQESSYAVQVEHYRNYIQSRDEWELVDIYADDGISGTNTMKREAFNRMIADCEAGKIDLIITKSISRFSRNTVDCLRYTRKLKEMNIGVFFEKENINTLDSKGEILMTIMAALAQQESESLSANVRLGIQFRNQQGKVQINHNRFLGYTKDEDGRLVIVPEEAEVVKRIYSEYLDGASLLQIKRGLEADGILNGAKNARWHESNIKQILTNEKYIGDALLQKTYTVDVLEKKRSKNNGILPKYYVEGSHDPIISKDAYMKAQVEMARRANLFRTGKKRVYSGKYALSSIVVCGNCGDIYRRIKWNNRGVKSTVWRCVSRLEKDGCLCTGRTITETDLQKAVLKAINNTWNQRQTVLDVLEKNISSVLNKDATDRIAVIERDLDKYQKELLSAGTDQEAVHDAGEKILALRRERQTQMETVANNHDAVERIKEMMDFLSVQSESITEYSETLVRRLVEQVTVYNNYVVVRFKSGLEVQVNE